MLGFFFFLVSVAMINVVSSCCDAWWFAACSTVRPMISQTLLPQISSKMKWPLWRAAEASVKSETQTHKYVFVGYVTRFWQIWWRLVCAWLFRDGDFDLLHTAVHWTQSVSYWYRAHVSISYPLAVWKTCVLLIFSRAHVTGVGNGQVNFAHTGCSRQAPHFMCILLGPFGWPWRGWLEEWVSL